MDIWVNKTPDNFSRIQKAIKELGLPAEAVPEEKFFSLQYDVFTFSRPPFAIKVLTTIKGVVFSEAYPLSTIETVDETNIRVVHINQLIQSKKAAGRHKDLNDIENLPQPEE